MANIGGLLFIGYICGMAIFSLYSNFHLENQLISKVYKNMG